MAGKMSNRDRIAHRALEAEATRKESEAAKSKKAAAASGATAASKPARRTTKKTAASAGRTRIVWVVCDRSGSDVKIYPYPEEKEALAEVQRLTDETGKTHFVTRRSVPFGS